MYLADSSTVFIHVRKTGGMSVGSALGLTPRQPEWHLGNDGVLDEWFRRTVQEQPVFVFACVRNPFDRLVSAWQYLEATRKRTLVDVLRDPPREGHDFRHLTRTQSAVLVDPATGQVVADYVMRFESLADDFAEACRRADLPPRPLPRLNRRRRHRHYRRKVSPEARRLAEQLFSEDLTRFNYEF